MADEIQIKDWRSYNEVLSSLANGEVLIRDLSDDKIKRIKSDLLSGGVDTVEQWLSTTTYASGEIVAFNSLLWESLQDNNLNQAPVEGSYWKQVNKSTANGFGRYTVGVYTVDPTVVINGDSLYILSESVTLPYNSTDFNAELTAGDWVGVGGDTFNSIKFNPNYEPTSTQEGEVYFNGKWHTIEYDTGLGAIIRVGQTVYDVFYNDTGVTIPSLKALHLKSAVLFDGELYPTFELADSSNYEKIQGTINISCCEVLPDALGVCVRDATKINGNTSSWPAGSQLWVSDDGSGDLTDTKPEFPSASISVGGNYNQDVNGEVYINITSTFGDIYHEAWDGSVIESFDFRTESDGVNIIGTLENVNPLLDLTLNFSDGTFRLDTTTTPLTIALTPGTDALEVTNYVYIPISTKVLTVSTSGWPTTEHCRIAELEIQSAATTQTDGGTLGNQNTNDHIKKEDDNGHILHLAEWIREQYATMRPKYGSEATFDNTGGNGYVIISAGYMFQAHRQNLEAFNMATGDQIRVWNDESGNRPKISNLASITTFADGSAWNNSWAKIVVWRVGNKGGEYAPVMLNKPTGGYNSSDAALADLDKKAVYTIPDNFKTKAVLIGEFAIRISGGVITYSSGYNDLRGVLPVSVAGGSSGGGSGVTTYLALTDTPSSRVGKAGHVIVSNAAENADEYEPKGWIYNAVRTFYHNIVSLATANRTVTFRDKDINVAGLDDLESVNKTWTTDVTIENKDETIPEYTQTGAITLTKTATQLDGGVQKRTIITDGSLVTFNGMDAARNDYDDLGNPSGRFRLLLACMGNNEVDYSFYQLGEVVFPLIVSASVDSLNPDELIINLNEACNITDITGLSLNFEVGGAKTITGINSGSGTSQLKLSLSADIVDSDVFDLVVISSNSILSVSTGNKVQPVTIDVTNGVASGAPLIINATVLNSDLDSLIITFNQQVDIADLTGLSLNFTTGTPRTLVSVTGDGTRVLTFALSGDISPSDEFSFEADGTNSITSTATSNSLQPVSYDVVYALIYDKFPAPSLSGQWADNLQAVQTLTLNDAAEIEVTGVTVGNGGIESVANYNQSLLVLNCIMDWSSPATDNANPFVGIGSTPFEDGVQIGASNGVNKDTLRMMIRISDANVYQLDDTGIAKGTRMKIVFDNTLNTQEFYQWNGSAWVQVGTTQNFNIGSVHKFYFGGNSGAVIPDGRTTSHYEDAILTDYNYTTEKP